MKARSLPIWFLFGAAFGGLVHLWLMDAAAVAAVRNHGLETKHWGVKPPGEITGFYIIAYMFVCSIFLALFLLAVLPQAATRGMYGRDYRPAALPMSWWPLLTAAVIGASVAGGINLRLMTGEYRSAIADGEWYSVSIVPTAFPALREFTAYYWIFLLACLACGLLLRTCWHGWRNTKSTSNAA